MDSQKKDPAWLVLPMEKWLTSAASDDVLVAWSRTQQWSLGDFRRDVSRLVPCLRARPLLRWALCFTDSYYFAVALLAVLHSGHTPVLPGHQRQSLLTEQQGEFDALLTDDDILALSCPTLRLPAEILPVLPALPATLPAFAPNAVLVLFTSGSTGKPQKVLKTVASLQTESQWLAENWGEMLQGSRVVATVSAQHMYGLTFRLILPLALGLPFYSQTLEVHEQLVFMANQHPLMLVSSPAFLQRLDDKLPPVHCRQIFSAGGPLAASEAGRVRQLCGTYPTDIYGTTETGVIASRQQRQTATPWTLFAGVELSQQTQGQIRAISGLIPQPAGVELSDNLALLADGRQFHLLGRKDRIVKIAEQRLSLDEIEMRLCQLPQVQEACVLTIDKQGRTYIAAAIVLSSSGLAQRQRQSQTALTAALRQALRPWLAPVAIPRFWRLLTAIPRNQQGKRSYAELQELFL